MEKGLSKIIIAALLAVVVAGAGAWLTWASDTVTESQAIDLIEIHSPYLVDRKILENSLEEVGELRSAIVELAIAVRELTVKVDHSLDAHHGDDH